MLRGGLKGNRTMELFGKTWGRSAGRASYRPIRQGRVVSRLALALLGLAALLVAACGPDSGAGDTLAPNQTFTWPYNGTDQLNFGEVLDPATIFASEDTGTISMLYSGLVTYGTNLSVVPDLATWTVDNTGTVYTFHLKQNLHFSDGNPLTAADVAYSLNRALDPTLCTSLDAQSYGPKGAGTCTQEGATYLAMILGAQDRLNGTGGNDHSLIGQGNDAAHGLDVVDPQTLQIRLSAPVVYFLEALTYPTADVLEKSLVEKYPGGTWVEHLDEGGTSGPFKVLSYGDGKLLKMVPNTSWEASFRKLTLTEVDRPIIKSMDDEYANYRAGQYDFTDVPGKDYTFARGQDDFNEVPTLTTQYFGLNFNKPPFNNLLIRRAFDLALNKQLLVDRILNGASIPTNHIVPRGMPGYDASLTNPPPDGTQSLTGNQDAANKLLQQAIASCQTPAPDADTSYCPYITSKTSSQEIDITYNSNRQVDQDITTAAAQTWRSVLGLNVKAVGSGVDTNTYFSNIFNARSYAAWSVGWIADYPDPQDWLSLQFISGQIYNAEGVNDNALNSLLKKADVDQNATSRMAEYNQAEQQAVNLVAWLPYAQGKGFWRLRTWVRGFGLNALLIEPDISWPNVYIVQH